MSITPTDRIATATLMSQPNHSPIKPISLIEEPFTPLRTNFLALIASYFLGVFNANFFKQVILLLAVHSGMKDLQGLATMIFTLPYLLATAAAGWFADRFIKRNVTIGVKILEFCVMILSSFTLLLLTFTDSLASLHWLSLLILLAIMGISASLFSPAINGTISELFIPQHVPKANSIVKVASTLAILLGVALAGVILDSSLPLPTFITSFFPVEYWAKSGQATAALICLSATFAGLLVSLKLSKHTAAGQKEPFPWKGPLIMVRNLIQIQKDPLLYISIWSAAFFWFMGALLVLIVNEMGSLQFNLNASLTSSLVASQMLGIAVGALLATRLSKGIRWYKILTPALVFMSLSFFLIACVPLLAPFTWGLFSLYFCLIFALLFSLGICGGIYLLPLESFIQVRPEAHCKGMTIATSNFVSFLGVLFSGLVYWYLTKSRLEPSEYFFLLSSLSLFYSFWMKRKFKRYEQALLLNSYHEGL